MIGAIPRAVVLVDRCLHMRAGKLMYIDYDTKDIDLTKLIPITYQVLHFLFAQLCDDSALRFVYMPCWRRFRALAYVDLHPCS